MENQIIPDEVIMTKIFHIRGLKVMLDKDLAAMYCTETKKLKQQVNRTIKRFPTRYMFELTKEENELLRSHDTILRKGEHSKYMPFAFTEHGILTLSNVLKNEIAVHVSIRIIDVFVKLREMYVDQTEVWLAIEKIKSKLDNHDKNMEIVF